MLAATTDFAPFRVTICGIDELAAHRAAGVSHVLSILDPGWPEPEAFYAFDPHRRLELRFHDVIDEGRGATAPQRRDVERLLDFGRELDAAPGSHLLVHCHAGVSRSSAAMTLILAQALPDVPDDAVLREVLRIRGKAWPNLRMIEIGDRLLGRGGALVHATHRLHRAQLDRRPELAEFMTLGGRGREVLAAQASVSPGW